MKLALFGDVHGCIDELTELYQALCHESLDEICSLGDLVDRGPDSGAVVAFCKEHQIKLTQGNHESSILSHHKTQLKNPLHSPKNEDKRRTLGSIRPEDWEYLDAPLLHVWDDLNVVAVHGGLYPRLPLWAQPQTVKYLQMIHPRYMGRTEWWGYEEEAGYHAQGWRRWTEVYEHEQLCVYGHSVYPEPHFVNNTLGLDTGCVFGGSLTAVILPDRKFISVRAKRQYAERRKST